MMAEMVNYKDIITHTNETKLIINCYHCDQDFEIIVDNIKFSKYRKGEISDKVAFSELSLNDYELLIGGICSDCLDEMY